MRLRLLRLLSRLRRPSDVEVSVCWRTSSRTSSSGNSQASRPAREHPGAGRGTQEQPEAAREHPEAGRNTREQAEAARSAREHPGAARSTHEQPGPARGSPRTNILDSSKNCTVYKRKCYFYNRLGAGSAEASFWIPGRPPNYGGFCKFSDARQEV